MPKYEAQRTGEREMKIALVYLTGNAKKKNVAMVGTRNPQAFCKCPGTPLASLLWEMGTLGIGPVSFLRYLEPFSSRPPARWTLCLSMKPLPHESCALHVSVKTSTVIGLRIGLLASVC